LWREKTRTTHSQTSISKTQKSKAWLVTWENTNHPLTNVNLKNTEIKSLACDVQLFCTVLHCGCSRKSSILDNVEHLRNITVIKSCCNSVMMLCWLSVKWLRLIYHVLNHTMQIPKYTNSPVSDTGSIEPLVYILQQFNNIYIWNFKVFVHLRTKLSTNKHFICMYIYVTR
jgi:hypothetical protein